MSKIRKKISKNNLSSLLEDLLKEADPVERPQSMSDFDPAAHEPVSLDQLIDKYLVQYEREAIPTSEVFESASVDNLTNFLLEQEEPPAEEEEEPAEGELDLSGLDEPPAGDETGELDLGDGEEVDPADEASAQPVVQTPKINLQDYSRSIARLVNNIQSLFDLKTVVLNRAERYIQNNYDEKTAKEMMEILDTSYDLRPVDATNSHVEGEKYPQPRTAVTGPVGG